MTSTLPARPSDSLEPTSEPAVQDAHQEDVKTPSNPQEGASAPVTNGQTADTTREVTNDDGAAALTTASSQPPEQVTEEQEDIPMAEQAATSQAEQPAGTDATTPGLSASNGTPAGNKRASMSGSTKKKASAVPEHKSKKLNRKKSRPLTHLEARPGDYYFARMKGHPPWPSIICDEEMLPHSLLSTRPVTAALSDGSFKKEDYADGGKRAYERTFPVMFLHTNEFAWIPNTELATLDPTSSDVTGPPEKGKSKVLLAAYAKAAENNELGAFKSMLAEHEKAIQEDLAFQEEKAAKKADKAKKAASRKSDTKANEDEMEIDDEPGAEKPKTKKRKKAADESDGDEKPSKAPKTATKLKLSTPKQPAESATKKKAQKPKVKTNKPSSDEDAQTPKVEERPLSPAQAREIMEKKVLYYRHKLQRGFLSRDAVPKADEMGQMSEFLVELENLPDLEGSIIRTTKIHKVLKQMIKLDSIPKEEEYKFKDRSSKLLTKWNDILLKDATAEENAGDKGASASEPKPETPAQDEAPAVNGHADQKEEPADKQEHVDQSTAPAEASTEAEAEAPASGEPSAATENKIGTDVEGEKEAHAGAKTEEVKATEPDAMDVDRPEAKGEDEVKTDAPAVDEAPAREYKPPAQDTVEAAV